MSPPFKSVGRLASSLLASLGVTDPAKDDESSSDPSRTPFSSRVDPVDDDTDTFVARRFRPNRARRKLLRLESLITRVDNGSYDLSGPAGPSSLNPGEEAARSAAAAADCERNVSRTSTPRAIA